MRVLLRDAESQCYLAHQGHWADSPCEGRDFFFTEHAREISARLRLKKFQILFYFPDLNSRIVVCDSTKDASLASA